MTDSTCDPARSRASAPVASALELEFVKRLETGRAGLPVLPQVATMALRLASDRNANLADLARLVETDPPIAARFLSIANSALYWRGFTIGSTQAAIVRLGLARARDLLFQVVYSNTTVGLKRFHADVRASFERSVSCAIAARVVSRELGKPNELDYMCGLLHDIGEARIYRILEDLPEAVPGTAEVQTLVRQYHCRAGTDVAMSWHLPAEIVDACAAHHDDVAPESESVRLVMIADMLVDPIGPDQQRLATLGIDASQWQRMSEALEREHRNFLDRARAV